MIVVFGMRYWTGFKEKLVAVLAASSRHLHGAFAQVTSVTAGVIPARSERTSQCNLLNSPTAYPKRVVSHTSGAHHYTKPSTAAHCVLSNVGDEHSSFTPIYFAGCNPCHRWR